MANQRVLQYQRQFGDNTGTLENFTDAQARSIGACLEVDGLAINKALELVSLWNFQGNRHGYQYKIPFVK